MTACAQSGHHADDDVVAGWRGSGTSADQRVQHAG